MRARPDSRLRFAFHAGAYRSASGGYVIYPLGLSDDGRGSSLWNAERRTPRRTILLSASVPLDEAMAACEDDFSGES